MNQKRGASTSNGSTGHSSKKRKISSDKAEQIAEVKGIHGSKYKELQYRLWSEMVVSGMHIDMHKPPSYPLFDGHCTTPVKQHTDSQHHQLPVLPFLQHHALWNCEANVLLTLRSWSDYMMPVHSHIKGIVP